ncbi:hypothetical protein B0A48_00703 [Cryoendolithus antarcticus]|uniref:Uncharacterized protein n=1 Tax=Cryoendolithus antarcticus TaxID=1507870 RepID=A0A1V8TV95_9PEZI|nr:hypothetical protein B0A48_00703 [Cryoendolithus antarcticus]
MKRPAATALVVLALTSLGLAAPLATPASASLTPASQVTHFQLVPASPTTTQDWSGWIEARSIPAALTREGMPTGTTPAAPEPSHLLNADLEKLVQAVNTFHAEGNAVVNVEALKQTLLARPEFAAIHDTLQSLTGTDLHAFIDHVTGKSTPDAPLRPRDDGFKGLRGLWLNAVGKWEHFIDPGTSRISMGKDGMPEQKGNLAPREDVFARPIGSWVNLVNKWEHLIDPGTPRLKMGKDGLPMKPDAAKRGVDGAATSADWKSVPVVSEYDVAHSRLMNTKRGMPIEIGSTVPFSAAATVTATGAATTLLTSLQHPTPFLVATSTAPAETPFPVTSGKPFPTLRFDPCTQLHDDRGFYKELCKIRSGRPATDPAYPTHAPKSIRDISQDADNMPLTDILPSSTRTTLSEAGISLLPVPPELFNINDYTYLNARVVSGDSKTVGPSAEQAQVTPAPILPRGFNDGIYAEMISKYYEEHPYSDPVTAPDLSSPKVQAMLEKYLSEHPTPIKPATSSAPIAPRGFPGGFANFVGAMAVGIPNQFAQNAWRDHLAGKSTTYERLYEVGGTRAPELTGIAAAMQAHFATAPMTLPDTTIPPWSSTPSPSATVSVVPRDISDDTKDDPSGTVLHQTMPSVWSTVVRLHHTEPRAPPVASVVGQLVANGVHAASGLILGDDEPRNTANSIVSTIDSPPFPGATQSRTYIHGWQPEPTPAAGPPDLAGKVASVVQNYVDVASNIYAYEVSEVFPHTAQPSTAPCTTSPTPTGCQHGKFKPERVETPEPQPTTLVTLTKRAATVVTDAVAEATIFPAPGAKGPSKCLADKQDKAIEHVVKSIMRDSGDLSKESYVYMVKSLQRDATGGSFMNITYVKLPEKRYKITMVTLLNKVSAAKKYMTVEYDVYYGRGRGSWNQKETLMIAQIRRLTTGGPDDGVIFDKPAVAKRTEVAATGLDEKYLTRVHKTSWVEFPHGSDGKDAQPLVHSTISKEYVEPTKPRDKIERPSEEQTKVVEVDPNAEHLTRVHKTSWVELPHAGDPADKQALVHTTVTEEYVEPAHGEAQPRL